MILQRGFLSICIPEEFGVTSSATSPVLVALPRPASERSSDVCAVILTPEGKGRPVKSFTAQIWLFAVLTMSEKHIILLPSGGVAYA